MNQKNYISLLLLASLTISFFYILKTSKPGIVILLNGTSSAGKTSIIKAWQKMYGNSYIAIIGDDFLKTYGHEHPTLESLPRNEAQLQILSDLFLQVKKLSQAGKNVIVDVVEFDDHYQHYCSILDCNKILKVLVYCPLDVIVKRVKKRNQSDDTNEKRPLNLSFGQFRNIYKLQESANEIIVDQIATSRMKYGLQTAEQEVRQLMKEAGENPENKIQIFVKPFIDQFKLNMSNEIILAPQHSWDLIVNTSIHSPQEIAQIIYQKIKR